MGYHTRLKGEQRSFSSNHHLTKTCNSLKQYRREQSAKHTTQLKNTGESTVKPQRRLEGLEATCLGTGDEAKDGRFGWIWVSSRKAVHACTAPAHLLLIATI